MDTRGAIVTGYKMADMVCQGYLADLTDAELMVRPVPGINHIAWQLGHLIAAENNMMSQVISTMPALPAGFAEKHSKETAGSDKPGDFLSKTEYLKVAAEQRQGVLAALEKMSDGDFDKAAPESMQGYAPTLGDLYSLIGSHWMMHAGQWAVVRRKLGRPPLF